MASHAHSAGFPPDSLHNLQVNTFWDGLFHAATYVYVVAGLAILWRRTRSFGAFNVVEGLVDHHSLGLHHV